MPAPGSQRYFLAFIPPTPILEEAHALKTYFREKYHSKASLNSPPHITLHMPFEWRENKENHLIEAVGKFASKEGSLRIQLHDFGSFEPRVIFIRVEENQDLNSFQKRLERFCRQTLNLFNAQYKELPFHPHLTIAFRDLKKQVYNEAMIEFQTKTFRREFTASHITLLKHDGKQWVAYHEFSLASPSL